MPTGVKVISVLCYITAVFILLDSLLIIIPWKLNLGLLDYLILKVWFLLQTFMLNGIPLLSPPVVSSLMVLKIIFFGLGVLGVFIGHGLWKGQKWSRITTIVFAILGIFGSLYYFISMLIYLKYVTWDISSVSAFIKLAASLLIGGYLAFAREVKEAFAQ